jgi:hypothetical protein
MPEPVSEGRISPAPPFTSLIEFQPQPIHFPIAASLLLKKANNVVCYCQFKRVLAFPLLNTQEG